MASFCGGCGGRPRRQAGWWRRDCLSPDQMRGRPGVALNPRPQLVRSTWRGAIARHWRNGVGTRLQNNFPRPHMSQLGNHVNSAMSALRPLMLQERRQSGHGNTSRSCQEATYAVKQTRAAIQSPRRPPRARSAEPQAVVVLAPGRPAQKSFLLASIEALRYSVSEPAKWSRRVFSFRFYEGKISVKPRGSGA
jgi:hypothetical protein